MQFDRTKYLVARQEVIDLIKQTHKWELDEGFIADGIICVDNYEKQELKILVVLAESYGYSHSKMVDIEEQLEEDIMGVGNPDVKTPKKVATLLWLLFESLETGRKVEYEAFPELLQTSESNYEELQSVLSKIAWINVKKASKIIDDEDNTTTRLDYMEIYNSCNRNKELLDIQIQSIQANLILLFSDPVIHSLYDNRLLGSGFDRNSKYVVHTNESGQVIMNLRHPNYLRDWSYDEIYETYMILYRHLCVANNTTHNNRFGVMAADPTQHQQ